MDKRELIIEEAANLFLEKGYYGLGLTELLNRCDIPKGSFYYYFPGGKKQLLHVVIQTAYDKMKYGIINRILVADNAVDSFCNMADYHAKTIVGRKYMESLMLTILSIESLHLDEDTHALCKSIYQDWQKLYSDKLIEYGYSERDAIQKAQALFALIHGTVISSFIKQEKEDLILIREVITSILSKN